MRSLLLASACLLLTGCGWTRCSEDRDCVIACQCSNGRGVFLEYRCSLGTCGRQHSQNADCSAPCAGALPFPDWSDDDSATDDDSSLDDDSAADDDSAKGR